MKNGSALHNLYGILHHLGGFIIQETLSYRSKFKPIAGGETLPQAFKLSELEQTEMPFLFYGTRGRRCLGGRAGRKRDSGRDLGQWRQKQQRHGRYVKQ